MADSFMKFTGGGSTFTFTKPFLSSSHISVEKNGTTLSLTTDYTITGIDAYPYTQATINLVSAAASSDIIIVRRTTAVPSGVMWKDFSDAAVLKADELDDVQRYLVFLAQEAEDEANLSLNEDYTANFDAEAKKITNVAGPVDGADAANKAYVDGQTLYGGAAVIPQLWNKTLADFSGTTGDVTITLSSPVPLSTTEELFLVAVGGAFQTPDDDFTLTVDGSGNYILTLKGLPSSPADEVFPADTPVSIRNYGIARNILEGDLEAGATDEHNIVAKRITGQTGDLTRWVNESYTGKADTTNVMAKMDKDGAITVAGLTTTTATVSGAVTLSGGATLKSNVSVSRTSDSAEVLSVANATGDTVVGASADGTPGGLTSHGKITANLGVDITGTLKGRPTSSDTLSDLLTIRQIVDVSPIDADELAAHKVADETGWERGRIDIGRNTGDHYTGRNLSITPKVTGSTIFIYHSVYYWGVGDTTTTQIDYNGAMWSLYKDNTQTTIGSIVNGTKVWNMNGTLYRDTTINNPTGYTRNLGDPSRFWIKIPSTETVKGVPLNYSLACGPGYDQPSGWRNYVYSLDHDGRTNSQVFSDHLQFFAIEVG